MRIKSHNYSKIFLKSLRWLPPSSQFFLRTVSPHTGRNRQASFCPLLTCTPQFQRVVNHLYLPLLLLSSISQLSIPLILNSMNILLPPFCPHFFKTLVSAPSTLPLLYFPFRIFGCIHLPLPVPQMFKCPWPSCRLVIKILEELF